MPFRHVKIAWSGSQLHLGLCLRTRTRWRYSLRISRHSPTTTAWCPLYAMWAEAKSNALSCSSGEVPPWAALWLESLLCSLPERGCEESANINTDINLKNCSLLIHLVPFNECAGSRHYSNFVYSSEQLCRTLGPCWRPHCYTTHKEPWGRACHSFTWKWSL